ncbi:MAG: hypothetical protein ACFFG0_47390 [Candidatus Thorarchaeota archaeon]
MKPEEDKDQGKNKNRIAPIFINMNNCFAICGDNREFIFFNKYDNNKKKKRRKKINIFLDGKKVISDYFSFQGYCCVSIDNERNRIYIETKEYLEGNVK